MNSPSPQVSVAELDAALAAGAFLLDVREPAEWVEARVGGGVLVPLGEVPQRAGEVPTDTTVYVICRSGGRSLKAVDFLRAQGLDAVNVAGGTLAWIDSGRPVASGPTT
jgi:rhodanese-related sulfurtransferase